MDDRAVALTLSTGMPGVQVVQVRQQVGGQQRLIRGLALQQQRVR